MPSFSGAGNSSTYDTLSCAGQDFISAESILQQYDFFLCTHFRVMYDFEVRFHQTIKQEDELLKMLNFSQHNHAFLMYLWEGGWIGSRSPAPKLFIWKWSLHSEVQLPSMPTWHCWPEYPERMPFSSRGLQQRWIWNRAHFFMDSLLLFCKAM